MFATIALPGWSSQASAEPIAIPSRTLTDCEQTDSAPLVVRACTALLNGQGVEPARAEMAEAWGEHQLAIESYVKVLKINGVYEDARRRLQRLEVVTPP
ncbi:MAG: hypothetical protein ABL907_13610 [Hyphomicrobium sp.]